MLRASLLLVTIAVIALLIGGAKASGESYILRANPSRTQESSSGVPLSLNVTNASFPSAYNFIWTVMDPSGNNRSIVKNQVSTQADWSLTVNYPNDFGSNLTFVGNYFVNVTQTLPTANPSVATTSFTVGLTDQTNYNRTYTSTIRALGYLPSDNVTVTVRGLYGLVQGFPAWNATGLDGSFVFKWLIPPSLPSGSYNITLLGKNTPAKAVQDFQTIRVYPTSARIDSLLISPSTIQRTGTVDFRVQASYPSNILVQTGTLNLRIDYSNGPVILHLPFDSGVARFHLAYKVPLNVSSGLLTATAPVGSLDDGYGNAGPSVESTNTFTVDPAQLSVSVSLSKSSFSPGDTIAITSTVTTPDGTPFGLGVTTATLSSKGQAFGSQVQLVYDQNQHVWIGSYIPTGHDPTGTWTFTVTALDMYGNTGSSSILGIANIPPTAPILDTYAWLIPVIVAIVFASVATILVARQRGRSPAGAVTLDVQAVKQQAEQVKSDDFFKSLQSQLEKKTAKWKAEKEDKEKNG